MCMGEMSVDCQLAISASKNQKNSNHKRAPQQTRRIMVFSQTHDLGRIIQLSLQEIAGWEVFVTYLNCPNFPFVVKIKPDAILLDTSLPNLDELTMLQMIQTCPALENIPVVLLTERMRHSDRQLYECLGVAEAIAKPFDLVNLIEQITSKLKY